MRRTHPAARRSNSIAWVSKCVLRQLSLRSNLARFMREAPASSDSRALGSRRRCFPARQMPRCTNRPRGSRTRAAGSLHSRPSGGIRNRRSCVVERRARQDAPGVAPTAIQQGRFVARVIRQEVASKRVGSQAFWPTSSFHYWDKGSLATIGRAAAVAEFGRIHISGFVAWLSWLFIHILFLIGFRNRLLVFIQWAWSYVTYERGARLITGSTYLPGWTAEQPDSPLPRSRARKKFTRAHSNRGTIEQKRDAGSGTSWPNPRWLSPAKDDAPCILL